MKPLAVGLTLTAITLSCLQARAERRFDGKAAQKTHETTNKARAFCTDYQNCMRDNPGNGIACVRDMLFKNQLTSHKLEVSNVKEMDRLLRREGFISPISYKNANLPDGAILLIDAHDPIKEKKRPCPKANGKVLVKCDQFWVDDTKNSLDYNARRGCRTKGVMVHPEF